MNEQRYNAFISYRRTEHDTAVAKEIQNSLERFRVPRGIRSSSGKERIDRIFRDQEELSITSNLSRRIEDALKAYGIDSAKASEMINSLPDTGEEDPDADPDQVKDNAVLWEGTPVPVDINYPDGEFSIEVNMIGGSGRASISSPTWLFVRDGKAYARLLWSSAYYDYMIIGDQKFYNLTKDGGNSTFTNKFKLIILIGIKIIMTVFFSRRNTLI